MTFPPIAMLHHIGDDPLLNDHKPYAISKTSFLRLLDYIERNGIETKDFNSWTAQSSSIFSKQIILTIDDCYKHLLDFAVPELQRRKMKAIFYMPTAHIGGYNDWDVKQGKTAVQVMDEFDLKDLSQAGFEIGVHSHQHIALAELNEEDIELELTTSKRILESITGKQVRSMAYPFGSVPKAYQKILKKTSIDFGLAIYHPKGDRYAVRRFIYHDGDFDKNIESKLSLSYRVYRQLTDRNK